MEIRPAHTDDLPAVLAIYEHARAFMKETGNPTQWDDGYPSRQLLEADVAEGALYVIEECGTLHGVFAFFPSGDPTYDELSASWLNDLPYGAIHRVASAGTRRGVLNACVEYCNQTRDNLKIDTHKDNHVMQSALEKLGFIRCGVCDIPDVGERILFQRSNHDKK